MGGLWNGSSDLVDDSFVSILFGSDCADVDADDEVVKIIVVGVVLKDLTQVLGLNVLLHSLLHFRQNFVQFQVNRRRLAVGKDFFDTSHICFVD